MGHKGGALIDGISAFMKETSESPLTLLSCEVTVRTRPSVNKEVGPRQTPNLPAPRSGFLSLRKCEKHISVVSRSPNLWHFCDSNPNGPRHRCTGISEESTHHNFACHFGAIWVAPFLLTQRKKKMLEPCASRPCGPHLRCVA